jgi:hypothetical protein
MNFLSWKTGLGVLVLLCMVATGANGQTNAGGGWFWVPDAQERGRGLPPGVPREVDTNGYVENVDPYFTTQTYQREADRLLVQEANHAAQALHLEDDQPITETRVKWVQVSPFGLFYTEGLIGNVATTNYTYGFLYGGKLNSIMIENSEEAWRNLQDELLPADQVNNQAAYQLATQWLASLSVDVAALNRDCQLTAASSPVLNYVGSGEKPIRRMFAPTYDVMWRKPDGAPGGPGAFVRLYLPDKLLIQLDIDDPKYCLRPPLIFTNLTALFPGKAKITTNYPTTPIVVSASRFGPMAQEVTFVTDSNQPEPRFHDLPLSQWIQTQSQLNSNHLSLSKLMTLKPVSGPDEWGRVAFDLPIRFEALQHHSEHVFPNGMIDLGSFDNHGNFIGCTLHDCQKAPDGNTRLFYNINWSSPGRQELRAMMTYYMGVDGDDFELTGPALSYYASNTCCFYDSSTLFADDGADLYAKLREPSAKFRVEVRSVKGKLVNNISSSTTNGEINLAWNLTGLDGNKFTNNSFIGSFYVTYPDDQHTNSPVKARFCKIGTDCDE